MNQHAPLKRVLDRVFHADALEVLKRLPPASVDLVVTDPPYGDNVTYEWRRQRIAGNEHPLLALTAMYEAYRVLKRNVTAYMFCGVRHLAFTKAFFAQYTRYNLRDVLVWDKVSMGVGYAFRKQYELVLVLEKGRPRYRNLRMLNLLSHRRLKTVEHPHTKPIPLIASLIEHSSEPGGVVLDPFIGSGTTALAARRLGRHYIGVEVDSVYYRLARQNLRRDTAKQLHP